MKSNVSFPEHDEETMPSDHPDIANALNVKRLYAAAHRHVDQLKTSERNARRLALLKDISHSEVGLHTAMPIGTVKTYAHRWLANFGEAMSAHPYPVR